MVNVAIGHPAKNLSLLIVYTKLGFLQLRAYGYGFRLYNANAFDRCFTVLMVDSDAFSESLFRVVVIRFQVFFHLRLYDRIDNILGILWFEFAIQVLPIHGSNPFNKTCPRFFMQCTGYFPLRLKGDNHGVQFFLSVSPQRLPGRVGN